MRLVAGRDLQRRGRDLDEVAPREPVAHGGGDRVALDQPRPAVGVDVGRPPGRSGDHRARLIGNGRALGAGGSGQDALGRSGRLSQPICANRLFQANKL